MYNDSSIIEDLVFITAVWVGRVLIGCTVGGIAGWMLWANINQDNKELSAGKSPHSGWMPAEEKEPLSHDMSSITIINQ